MKKSEMIQKRESLLAEAGKISETAASENRALTEEEGKDFDSRMDQAKALRADIARQDCLDAEAGFAPATVEQPDPEIGLTEKEAKSYSFIRAINAAASGNWANAGFERECSVAAEAKLPAAKRGTIVVPHDVLVTENRDLTVGTGTGDQIVGTDLMAGSFIEILRNRMIVKQAGARMLSGLVGNVAIPRHKTSTTAYWVDEDGAPTESASAYEQVTLSPKTLGAYEDLSRQLLKQSTPDAEMLVRDDIAQVIAVAIDYAALHGSGASNQPTGLASTSGIGSVVGGTNGAAPDWSDIVSLETKVAIDNADMGALAYVTNAAVRGYLKGAVRVSSTDSRFIWAEGGQPLNGYKALVSNQVSSTLTKGTTSNSCSAIFFGNWNDLLIGMWGGLDLLVNPYTLSTTGQVRIVAFQSVDIAVRHPESFSAMLDATLA